VSLRRTIAALAGPLAGLALLAGPAAALAGPENDRRAVAREPLLWATVNVCDTVGHPDGMGVRGSMPGTGDRRDELFMRLQVEFRRADGLWRGVGRSGDSGFIDLGHGGARARQAGRTFTVTPPAASKPAFLLRGLVTFEWRRDGEVLRRARRATTAGHSGTLGADPPDFSAAACSIR
jgi:hypothetical protein